MSRWDEPSRQLHAVPDPSDLLRAPISLILGLSLELPNILLTLDNTPTYLVSVEE